MKRMIQMGLLLASANVSAAAASMGDECLELWRLCECYAEDLPENCCIVCTDACLGYGVVDAD